MKSQLILLLLLIALYVSARAEEQAKFRVTLHDGQVLLAVSVLAHGVDELAITTIDGTSLMIARRDLARLERRLPDVPKGKLASGVDVYFELRPGYLIPTNEIKEFKPGLSYGGSVGYTTGDHSVEGSFSYFYRAVQKNKNNLDTLRLGIASLEYLFSVRLTDSFRMNLGGGPSFVFFSRKGQFTGRGDGSKFTGIVGGGFSLGPFYTYGRYLIPFKHTETTQKPTTTIKYGAISVQAGLRF